MVIINNIYYNFQDYKTIDSINWRKGNVKILIESLNIK